MAVIAAHHNVGVILVVTVGRDQTTNTGLRQKVPESDARSVGSDSSSTTQMTC